MPPGPRPQPTVLKLVRGNPAKKKLPENEPSNLPALVLEPPAHLTERVQEIWMAYAKLLSDIGVLTIADGSALERMSRVHYQVETLEADIEANGYSYSTKDMQGEVHEHKRPEAMFLSDADRRLKGYLTEFGLTPSSRTRVKTNGGQGKTKEEADSFFS